MKLRTERFVSAILALVLSSVLAFAQSNPLQLSLIELLANPGRVNGKVVAVRGFLRFHLDVKRAVIAVFLDISREDSDNRLGNEVVVVPNEQMLRSREKLDAMYVDLVGTVRVVPAANGASTSVIRDIQRCSVWSDPNHPIALKGEQKDAGRQ